MRGNATDLPPKGTRPPIGAASRFLSATDAAAALGISRGSLYSYVSRGRIRAEPDPRNPRVSRYLAADVLRLRDGKEARLHPDIAARKTLRWGIPVLESSLTLINDGRFYYRGQDALTLARRASFEDVVRLLWNTPSGFDVEPQRLSPSCRDVLKHGHSMSPMQRMQSILPIVGADDPDARDTTPAGVAMTGWRVLRALVAAATLREADPSCSIAASLASGWKVAGAAAINTALVLSADHELNVSAFAARVVASARSTPYDVVCAGLAALAGPLHGGHTSRVEEFLDHAGSPQRVRKVLADRLRNDASIPGFGHPLYPAGDPRGRMLFALVRRHWPSSEAAAYAETITRAGRDLLGEFPTVDCGLVMLRRALGLPRGSALVMFAIGRTAGWIAHAIEQYATEGLIRPRAAYAGLRP
jgi:citrate synthase